MVFCAVIGCSNNSQKTRGISYFRFPSLRNRGTSYNHPKCAKRLAMWIKALRRADLTMNKIQHERVCSNHFISGAPASFHDENNPDWVPTLNLGYTKVDGKFKRIVPEKEDVYESEDDDDGIEYDDEDEMEDEENEDEDFSNGQSKVMLGTTCIVDSCKNNLLKTRKKGLNISYYRFPVEEKLLLKWKDRCKLNSSNVLKSARICSEHFKDDDFHLSSFQGKRQLKPEAVPSLNLGGNKLSKTKLNNSVNRKKRIKGNSSNSEDEISQGSDYEEVIKVRIAPMDGESSSDESQPRKRSRKRKISSASDIKAIDVSDSSGEFYLGVDNDGKWMPSRPSKISAKKEKMSEIGSGRKRKVYDDRAEEDFDPLELEELNERVDDTPAIVMPPSLGSMLKEGKLVPDDKEAIIKMLEERILEHSRIVEDKNVTPFSSKSKKKVTTPFNKSALSISTDSGFEKNDKEEAITFSIPLSALEIEDNYSTKVSPEKSVDSLNRDNLKSPNADLLLENGSKPDTFESLKKKYDILLTQKIELQKENSELKQKLKACNEELKTKCQELQVSTVMHDNVVAKLTKIETCLSKMLTPNQIKLLLNDVKKVSWTPQEMLSAFTIRYLSKRCYYYLRQKLNYPLPGISSVQRWAAVMTKQHGGNLKEVEEAVYMISGDCDEEEEEVMFFPNATDDVVIEGSDEPNQNDGQELIEHTELLEEKGDNQQETESGNMETTTNFTDEQEQIEHDGELKEHVIYIKREENWEEANLVNENVIGEYSEDPECVTYQEERTDDDRTDGPLLKALLIGKLEDQQAGESGEQQDPLSAMQTVDTNENAEEFPHNVILVEAIDGVDPETIQWQVENAEEGGHYYITDENVLARFEEGDNIHVLTEEGVIENCKQDDPTNAETPTFSMTPENFEQGENNDRILHYLYRINEVSPLTTNNSADHSYAIATIDKYIRTKERHKNRRPAKRP
ncbi:uncharacterized protein LOC106670658 [Cimex lectularius]|uniref:THAP-type domain-containing protein n=1 Tax=Cimex lectularius TaxID=79782 RepID=A0A8I6S1Y6_CIMLE|nr:uncharacterized protein LOC106670658 [Cimex lectularius]